MIAAGEVAEVEIAHANLQACITTVAKKEIVQKNHGSYRCLPTKLKWLVMKRNGAGSKWRKACIKKGHNTTALWTLYKRAAKEVAVKDKFSTKK